MRGRRQTSCGRRWARTLRLVVGLAIAGLVATGCGAADTRRRQDLILESGRVAADKQFAAYTLSITSERKPVDEEPARPIQPPKPLTLEGRIDFEKSRATVTAPGQPEEIVVFDDAVMYVRRHKRGQGATDPRTWASFDFSSTGRSERDAVDVRGSLGFLWLNPGQMVRTTNGGLTGSLSDRGAEQVQGMQTTHWTANYDIDKSIREDNEDHRRAVRHAFRTMGHRQPSFQGAVWIDDEGVAHRFAMTLEQQIDRDNIMLTTYTIELSALGTPVDIEIPSPRDTKEVDNQVRLLLEFDVPEETPAQ